MYSTVTQWRIQEEGQAGPDLPIRPDAYLRMNFLDPQDRILLIKWLIFFFFFFFKKRALHFATKLNSRDYSKM